jgi:hypothetical protein
MQKEVPMSSFVTGQHLTLHINVTYIIQGHVRRNDQQLELGDNGDVTKD